MKKLKVYEVIKIPDGHCSYESLYCDLEDSRFICLAYSKREIKKRFGKDEIFSIRKFKGILLPLDRSVFEDIFAYTDITPLEQKAILDVLSQINFVTK